MNFISNQAANFCIYFELNLLEKFVQQLEQLML